LTFREEEKSGRERVTTSEERVLRYEDMNVEDFACERKNLIVNL